MHMHMHMHTADVVAQGSIALHAYAQVDGHADASAVLIDLLLLGQVR
jgi:hypothetical protein